MITITVNGEQREVGDGSTVRGLIESLGLSPEKVAIERNKRLVRSKDYDAPLAGGDAIEIVTFVGGG